MGGKIAIFFSEREIACLCTLVHKLCLVFACTELALWSTKPILSQRYYLALSLVGPGFEKKNVYVGIYKIV